MGLRLCCLHSSLWALSTTAITRLLLSLQKRIYIRHITVLNTSEPHETVSARWPHVPSGVGSPLNDPFYAYYTAPFPMAPEIELSAKRCSRQSFKQRTVGSTRSVSRPTSRKGRDGNDEHEGMSIVLATLGMPKPKDLPPDRFKDLPPIPSRDYTNTISTNT